MMFCCRGAMTKKTKRSNETRAYLIAGEPEVCDADEPLAHAAEVHVRAVHEVAPVGPTDALLLPVYQDRRAPVKDALGRTRHQQQVALVSRVIHLVDRQLRRVTDR